MRTDLSISSLGSRFVDLRDSLPGDAFNWSWIRLLSEVKFLAVHHSGGPDDQTPQSLADFHINTNGWGGIGYHFIIDQEGTVFYVGDLQTARANVANLNEQVIGICLIGNFTGSREPTVEQLDSAHKLCDFFINQYPDLTYITGWEALYGHKELPGQSTDCPGDNWSVWKKKLIGGDVRLRPVSEIVFNPPINSAAIFQGQTANLQETIDCQKRQIDNLQTNLATVNGQLISCRESLQQAERKIYAAQDNPAEASDTKPQKDNTFTIIDAVINLFKFIFLSGKSS